MLRSILRNFSAFGAGFAVEGVVTFFFLIYAARSLGPERYGQYLLIGTYVLFFNVTFAAGVLPVAVREFMRRRDDPGRVLEETLSLRLVLGCSAYTTLILVTVLVLPVGVFLPLALIAGSSLVINAFKESFAAYHTAFERMVIPSAFQAATTILTALSGVAILYLDHGIVVLLAAGTLVECATTLVWHVLFTRRFQRYRIRLAFSAWKHMLLLAAAVAPLQLAFQLNRLASVMMLSLVPGPMPRERAVGYFGPAQQIANFPLGLLVGMRRAMLPPIATKLRQGEGVDREFAVALKMAVVFASFPLLVATSVFAEEVLQITFGRDYLQSALALKLLGAAAALAIAAITIETFLISDPEAKFARFLPGAYVPLLLNVTLCAVLIPSYGGAGAGVGILAARAAHFVFTLYYCCALLRIGRLALTRMAGPLTAVCGAYAACLFVGYAVEQPVLRVVAVLAVALLGMLSAGHREMRWLLARMH